MNKLLTQILAARNTDAEGWMNILLVVAIAIFYGLGSIVKARANKARTGEQEQLGAEQPKKGQKPPGWRAGPESNRAYRPPRKIARLEPALQPLEEPPRPQIQPDLEELPEFTAKTVKKLEDKRIGVPAEMPGAKHLSEILSDYADPDELKRAILHYEILGRPLSLRGRQEHTI